MIQSNLCHIEKDRAVVQVIAWENGKQLGSSLGEGKNVEEAEEKALNRLMQRIKTEEQNRLQNQKELNQKNSTKSNKIEDFNQKKTMIKEESFNKNLNTNSELYRYPDDWSKELLYSDKELERIEWTKTEENSYLKRAFSIMNRNRITSYELLYEYITQLSLIKKGEKPDTVKIPEFIPILMDKSDKLIKELGWDLKSSKKFLKDSMKMESRRELNKEQLIKFTKLLEELVIKANKK